MKALGHTIWKILISISICENFFSQRFSLPLEGIKIKMLIFLKIPLKFCLSSFSKYVWGNNSFSRKPVFKIDTYDLLLLEKLHKPIIGSCNMHFLEIKILPNF